MAKSTSWTVVFALEREAAPFRRLRPDVPVVVSGIGATRVAAAADNNIRAQSPSAILMCGFAGALRGELPIGHVMLPATVVAMPEPGNSTVNRYSPTQSIPGQDGVLLTVNRLIAGPTEKRDLGRGYSADIVDMETAAVARVCQAAGIPWASVRVVSDEVDKEVAPEIEAMLAEGTVSKFHLFVSLVKRPSLIGHYYGLAKDTNLAAKRLAERLAQIIPTIG